MKITGTFQPTTVVLFSLYFWYCVLTPTGWHFIDGVNLIFHEAGHVMCMFLPTILTALAGSVFQILIPIVCAVYFYGRGEGLSAIVMLEWSAQNIMSVSLYIRDAIPMQLELLGGDSSIHDWNYILSATNLLSYSEVIASTLTIVSFTILLLGTVFIISEFFNFKKNIF